MFAEQTLSGQPINKTYARTRARWELLLEVTQVKGGTAKHIDFYLQMIKFQTA